MGTSPERGIEMRGDTPDTDFLPCTVSFVGEYIW
jgi:hypothetical protein